MKITLQADGSLIIDGPLTRPLFAYYQDPENPNRYIPKFEPCKHRENRCKMSPCKQHCTLRWHCIAFNKTVTPTDCKDCEHEKQ